MNYYNHYDCPELCEVEQDKYKGLLTFSSYQNNVGWVKCKMGLANKNYGLSQIKKISN